MEDGGAVGEQCDGPHQIGPGGGANGRRTIHVGRHGHLGIDTGAPEDLPHGEVSSLTATERALEFGRCEIWSTPPTIRAWTTRTGGAASSGRWPPAWPTRATSPPPSPT